MNNFLMNISNKIKALSSIEKMVLGIVIVGIIAYICGYGIGKFVSHWNHR